MQGQGVDSCLDKLDRELEKKEFYDAQKEQRIGQIRNSLKSALDNPDRYGISRNLFEEYKSYKYDSAYVYARRMEELAAELGTADRVVEARCATTFCLLSAGLYKEAFDAMESLSTEGVTPHVLLKYYQMQVRLYYSAREYAQTDPYFEQYSAAGELYSQKLLELLPADSPLAQEYQANLLMEQGSFEESIQLFTAPCRQPVVRHGA